MPSIKGQDAIVLQPGTTQYTFTVNAPQKTDNANKKGYLPVGVTISSVAITAQKNDGTDATSALIISSSYTTTTISIKVKYPTALGEGIYDVKMILTLSNSDVIEEDARRIIARNK